MGLWSIFKFVNFGEYIRKKSWSKILLKIFLFNSTFRSLTQPSSRRHSLVPLEKGCVNRRNVDYNKIKDFLAVFCFKFFVPYHSNAAPGNLRVSSLSTIIIIIIFRDILKTIFFSLNWKASFHDWIFPIRRRILW